MVAKQLLNDMFILNIITHKEGEQPLFVLLFKGKEGKQDVMLVSLYNI